MEKVKEIRQQLNARLEGAPNEAITAGLLVTAGVLVLVALCAKPDVKAVFLTWAVLP